jgi:hypothetical protein
MEGPDHLEITSDGLFQFTFGVFVDTLGANSAETQFTISTNPFASGDLLSHRNRGDMDRFTDTGVTTAYLTAGDRVWFDVSCNRTHAIGNLVFGPFGRNEVRTFLDVRRLE